MIQLKKHIKFLAFLNYLSEADERQSGGRLIKPIMSGSITTCSNDQAGITAQFLL
jgi:hypothetical protein